MVTIDNRAAPHGCDPERTINNRAADLRRPGARATARGGALISRRNRATAMRGPGEALNSNRAAAQAATRVSVTKEKPVPLRERPGGT